MRWKIVSTLAALVVMGASSAALASTTTVWDGNGAENLPCSDGGHWILSPAQGITAATITVNGVSYEMIQNGQGSFAVDSVGTLSDPVTASASYDGENDAAFLKLSHCTEGGSPTPTPTEPPSPTTTPSPSPSETTSPSPSVTNTHTPRPSTSTHTTEPGSESSVPPTASTGVSSKAIRYAILALLLLALGTYLLRRASKA